MNVQLIESKKAVASAIATRSSSNASFYSSARGRRLGEAPCSRCRKARTVWPSAPWRASRSSTNTSPATRTSGRRSATYRMATSKPSLPRVFRRSARPRAAAVSNRDYRTGTSWGRVEPMFCGNRRLRQRHPSIRVRAIDQRVLPALPIVTIYFLGYDLGLSDEPVIDVCPGVTERRTGRELEARHPLVEGIHNRSHIIQIPRLASRRRDELERVLAIFDQGPAYGNGWRSPHMLTIAEEEYPAECGFVLRQLREAIAEEEVRRTIEGEDVLFRDSILLAHQVAYHQRRAEQGQQRAEQRRQQTRAIRRRPRSVRWRSPCSCAAPSPRRAGGTVPPATEQRTGSRSPPQAHETGPAACSG